MSEDTKKIKKQRTLLQKIVNIFLYTGIGIAILIFILFGFSQTATFRDFLRKTVVENVNSSINGKLEIGKIDGTIFTSLMLRDVSLTLKKDTLLKAETITVKTSPLQLLRKRIFIRKFEIKNASISLIKEKDGKLNVSKLTTPSKETSKIDTSKPSPFPLYIESPEVKLNNVNFVLQRYDKIGSEEFYQHLNLNDLRAKNLNLSLKAFVDIASHNFAFTINHLSVSPNLYNFSLNNLSGNFLIDSSGAEVKNLSLVTSRTNVSLDASFKGYNFFSPPKNTNIDDASLSVELNAQKFNFDNLTSFVPSTKILQGTVSTYLNATGTLKNLEIKKLNLNFLDTHLNLSGNIKDVIKPKSMFIDANLDNSSINQLDVDSLLPSLKLPVYKKLGELNFNKLSFTGNPLNFLAKLDLKTNKGSIGVSANLNMLKKPMSYKVDFNTSNLDLEPIIGLNTNLISNGVINGYGVSPQNLNAKVKFNSYGSTAEGIKLDTLNLNVNAKDKKITYAFKLSSDTTKASLSGNFDFTKTDSPTYAIKGALHKLNLARIVKDTTLKSNLNFALDGSGDHFDLEKMNLFLSLKLYQSYIRGVNIDTTRAIVDLRSDDNGERVVNIISDLADITFTGNYSIGQTIGLIKDEGALLSSAIKNKMNNITYPDSNFSKQLNNGVTQLANKKSFFGSVDTTNNLKYVIEFKDFSLLSIFLGNNKLELDGYVNGAIQNSRDSISLSMNTNLESVKYWGSKDVFFLSKLNSNIEVKNNFEASELKNINASVGLSSDRIFTGKDFHNLLMNFNLQNDSASVAFSADLNKLLNAKFNSIADLSKNTLNLFIDTLAVDYKDYKINNNNRINVTYSGSKISLSNFKLYTPKGNIALDGFLTQNGNQNLQISVSGISGKELSTTILGTEQANSLGADINIDGKITGDYTNPLMNLNLNVNNVTYKSKNFGSLKADLYYKNRNISTYIAFLDSLINFDKPALKITGNIPVNLAFEKEKNRAVNTKQINLKLSAENFNLGAFGDILPMVNHLKGRLQADLKIGGTLNDILPNGYLNLKGVSFLAEANNLEYDAGLKLKFKDHSISLDSLLVANSFGTKLGGSMSGSGEAILRNMEITSSKFSVNGELKVLSKESKSVSPGVYGDLVIATNGNIEFTTDKNGSFLKAPIEVKTAKLTFPPTQTAYQNSSDNFIYKYVNTGGKSKNEMDFESLVKLSKERSAKQNAESDEQSKFNYSIDISVANEATLVFILSRETNFDLTAVLRGNFKYEYFSGHSTAQGELTLLDGSNLKFLKTFEASGTIRFENELNNPYLNITATYSDYYSPPSEPNKEEQVAVKIKLNGPLKNLDENFTKEKNNIAVYVGSDNIQNDTPDPQYDATDAIMFILQSRFASDRTQNSNSGSTAQSNQLQGTANSIASSLLGGFLNHYLGDYVRGVELRTIGSTTKFNLTGRVNKFRYTIGGTTDVFSNLSQANIKIEYPFTQNLLFRIERKESVTETNLTNEMINEVGLKYRFEF